MSNPKSAAVSEYVALLLKIFNLEEQFRTNPPKDPAAYVAALEELKALYDEVTALVKSGQIDATDIESAHARNQTTWNDPTPPKVDSIYEKPIFTKPTVPPFQAGDHVYQKIAGGFVVVEKVYGVTGFMGANYIGDLNADGTITGA